MQLLIIGAIWPEPNSSAAGSRMLQLISLFQRQGWHVTFATSAAQSIHAIDLAAQNVSTVAIEMNNPSFDGFVRDLNPNAVIFDRYMSEEQYGWRVAEHCPSALRILNTEDLHFWRKARHAQVKSGNLAGWCALDCDLAALTTDLAKREIAAIYRSDLTLLISEAEIELLTKTFRVDEQLLHYTPFMLPDEPLDLEPSFAERQHFVTIGNFRHAPNWDGVLQLKEVIWPLIKDQLPDAEMHIYGAYPPPKATALHNKRDRFFVRGWADDAHAVMRQARLCLAPLRFGAGLKGKLITAMQCGTPSVTTPIGAEGMAGDLAWGGTVAADPESFAAAAVALYTHEAAWRAAQANGSAILKTRFDSAENGQALITRITQLRTDLDAHRLKNFMGSMLTHHTLQSTKYLSRWIELKEKNK